MPTQFPEFGEPIFADYFEGLGAGQSVEGRTPTVPVASNVWTKPDSASWEGNGAGSVQPRATGALNLYDTGITRSIIAFRVVRPSPHHNGAFNVVACADATNDTGLFITLTPLSATQVMLDVGAMNYGSPLVFLYLGTINLAEGAAVDYLLVVGETQFGNAPIQMFYKAAVSAAWIYGGTTQWYGLSTRAGMLSNNYDGDQVLLEFVEVYPYTAPTLPETLIVHDQFTALDDTNLDGRMPAPVNNGAAWAENVVGRTQIKDNSLSWPADNGAAVSLDAGGSALAVRADWSPHGEENNCNSLSLVVAANEAGASPAHFIRLQIQSYFAGFGEIRVFDKYGDLGNESIGYGPTDTSSIKVFVYPGGTIEVYDGPALLLRTYSIDAANLGNFLTIQPAIWVDSNGRLDNLQVWTLAETPPPPASPVPRLAASLARRNRFATPGRSAP